MPFATFARIRDVSSEAKHHEAGNLIKPQPGRTWKTCYVGEKMAYVILEMDEAKKITGIDIGNEHSAFVEVLVGNSTCLPSDFKEILITCSFMTPIESRSSNNSNRVRCFNEAALVPSTAEKKWSLVKFICTQPFNKHVQYGLSFVKVHVAQNTSTINNQSKLPICSEPDHPTVSKIGKFKIREDSPDSENEGAAKLFARWKKSKDEKVEQTTSTVSIIHAKDTTTGINKKTSLRLDSNVSLAQTKDTTGINQSTDRPENLKIMDRNRDDVMFGGEEIGIDVKKESRFASKLEIDKQRRFSELQKMTKDKHKTLEVHGTEKTKHIMAQTSTPVRETISCEISSSLECVKKRHSSPPAERPSKKEKISHVLYKPFNRLLEGVVLVISGIQNPDRCNLRNKALSLGAKYKGDWDHSCTHLICAFKNTPKYNQVKTKGKIITRAWIEKCYSSKKYLPWRRYALDSEELAKPESDEEIHDESLKPHNNTENIHQSERHNNNDASCTLSLYDIDNHPSVATTSTSTIQTSSGSDTDDEIQRVKAKIINRKSEPQKKPLESNMDNLNDNNRKKLRQNSDDVYELPTDEEDYVHNKRMQADTIKK